jgi:molybdopterin-guanine dinucleotide biosynthesis protein A
VAHHGLTGVLLVGGASSRFGSPKALARLDGETLAERAWRVLGEVCDERLAVGKARDELALPFRVLDDAMPVRAPIAGVVAGIRAASNDLCVFLPVDCPCVSGQTLLRLATEAADAAVPQTGPLPGAYRRGTLPALERSLAQAEYSLRDALRSLDVTVVEFDPAELVNVNTQAELQAVAAFHTAAALEDTAP